MDDSINAFIISKILTERIQKKRETKRAGGWEMEMDESERAAKPSKVIIITFAEASDYDINQQIYK